ncbi:glycosyltransferase [Seonamhaeicola maritimus]|uniref:glycosyltransferase n=1 Tax=Seonamhaeicola maritimus TaxID=2591822 RepID=UPI002495520E|nr:glycosyltransferase [Seonamhaeicola maritimus]
MKKVCIITTSLGKGGAERSTALLSKMLSNQGFEVHIIMTKNDVDYSFSGTLFNLEKEYGTNLSNFKKFTILRCFFRKHHFDVLIDNRPRPTFLKEYLLYNYVFKAKKKIAVVHSCFLRTYFPINKQLVKILYYRGILLVAVSEEIKTLINEKYSLKNVKRIHNAVPINDIKLQSNIKIDIKDRYIIWYGRLEEKVKNLSLLLEAYKSSSLQKKNVKLYILGDGGDLNFLKAKVKILRLADQVVFLPFTSTPFPYVKKALFTVLTSRFEGFPGVLVESLACGIPIVSVNCKSGPKEIVKHKFNGLLVQNHSITGLAKAFDNFIENKELYDYCKKNARRSVGKFSVESIIPKWKELLT